MPIKDYDKPAEIALIEACRMGGGLQISTELPTEGTAENTIRAGLIRELLLGTEDCKPPAQGLHIWGAWIYEHLSLMGEAVPVSLLLYNCTLIKKMKPLQIWQQTPKQPQAVSASPSSDRTTCVTASPLTQRMHPSSTLAT